MDKVNKIFYIEVEPKYMTSDIHNVIHKKIIDKYTNTCSEKNGYVLDILNSDDIVLSGINDCTNNLFFKVNCQINILLPRISKKIKCTVNMIFQHGIFAGFKNLKVLIPIKTLEGWEHNHSENFFTKDSEKICIDNIINVEITEIRYENCKYSCIGKLVE